MFDDGKQADGLILQALAAANGAMTAGEVAGRTGLNLRRSQRRLHRLAEAGQVRKAGRGYVLSGDANAPGQAAGGGKTWWWDKMKDSKPEQEVLAETANLPDSPSPPSPSRSSASAPPSSPSSSTPPSSWSETEARLRHLWVQGYHDQGGNENRGRLQAGRRIRLFLSTRGLLHTTKLPEDIPSLVYLQGRADYRREVEQDEQNRQAEQRRRDMAIRTKELEEQRQAERLGRQLLFRLAQCLKNGGYCNPILRKYGVPDNEHEQWISFAKKLIAH